MPPGRRFPPSRLTSLLGHALACGALSLCQLAPAIAQQDRSSPCGSLQNAYGPFDYRSQRDKIGIVEQFHFTPPVEALMKGESGSIGGDLDYTLRASPNHHRALLAAMRLGERTKSPQPPTLPRPIECYFERALRFQEDDTVVRMLYARFLASQQRRREAGQQLARVTELAGDNPLTHYNAGLLYVELQDYDKALVQAHRAMRFGHDAAGLRERLQAAGHWRPPSGGAAGRAASPQPEPKP